MNPTKVILDKYITFEHAEVDLTDNGVYFITGDNRDEDDCIANKAGKSNFLSCFLWIPFGETPNNITGDSILGVFEKGCRGELQFMHADGNKYAIVRHRKHSEFKNEVHIYKYDGAKRSCITKQMRPSDVNKEIVDLLGFTKDQMLKTVFHHQSHYERFTKKANKRFLHMGNAERQDFLLFIMNWGWIDDAKKYIDGELNSMAAERSRLESKLEDLGRSQEHFEKESADYDDVIAGEKEKIKRQDAEIKNLKIKLAKSKKKHGDESKLVKENNEIAIKKADIERECSEKLQSMNKEEGKLDASKTMINSKIEDSKREINRIEHQIQVITKIENCPTCKQDVGEKHKDVIRKDLFKILKEARKKVESDTANLANTDADHKALTAKIQEVKDKRDATMKKLSEKQKSIKSKIELAREATGGVKEDIASRTSTISAAREKIEAYEKSLTNTAEQIESIKQQIKEATYRVKSLRNDIRYYDFMSMRFGRDNVKKMLLEEVIPEINIAVNETLEEIDDEIRVEISVTDKRSGEIEFSIFDKANQPKPLNVLSGRELAAVEFAMDSAIEHQVMQSRNIDFSIEDESAFESLDAAGIKAFMGYFQRLKSKVLLVSHRVELKKNFDNVLFVVKEGGISRMEKRK